MRFIKLALISVIILFGVITLISSFMPSHVRISRAIDIDEPKQKVYRLLDSLQKWEQWNEYIRSFQSKKVNGDSLRADQFLIVLSGRDDSLITAKWQQPSGKEFSSGYFLLATDDSHTTMQWYFDFHLRWYPWEKFQGIIYDQQLGPDMEKSLQHLKKMAEQLQ